MFRCVLLLCSLPLVGCGFLDDDLLLDDEEYEMTLYGSYHGSYSSSCGSRRAYRRSIMRMGEPMLWSEDEADIDEGDDEWSYEFEFEDDDITASIPPDVLTQPANLPQPKVDPWLSEFIRVEDEQLRLNHPVQALHTDHKTAH